MGLKTNTALHLKNLRIGVILSSGGARGVFAHTGFLQALEQLNIEVVALAGCSAGALVGGIYASGTSIEKWSSVLADTQPRDYWRPDSKLRFLWNLIVKKGRGYTGFSEADSAINFIRKQLSAETFAECRIPFYSLAMNLSCSKKTFFADGELAPRIMASAAIPLLYRPVEINGELFSDGATLDLAPTDAICCKHKLDILIVHHVAIHCQGQAGLQHVISQPWTILQILFLKLYSEKPWYLIDKPVNETYCQCGCGALVLVLKPDLPELGWPMRGDGLTVQRSAREQGVLMLEKLMEKWGKNSAPPSKTGSMSSD